jgi:hypothetical protein
MAARPRITILGKPAPEKNPVASNRGGRALNQGWKRAADDRNYTSARVAETCLLLHNGGLSFEAEKSSLQLIGQAVAQLLSSRTMRIRSQRRSFLTSASARPNLRNTSPASFIVSLRSSVVVPVGVAFSARDCGPWTTTLKPSPQPQFDNASIMLVFGRRVLSC